MVAVKYLNKVATQCRATYTPKQCVTSYYVKVKITSADDYTDVCGTGSCPQLFPGNDPTRHHEAVATNEFDWPIAARFVRLNPQVWYGHIALRWEIYGCDQFNWQSVIYIYFVMTSRAQLRYTRILSFFFLYATDDFVATETGTLFVVTEDLRKILLMVSFLLYYIQPFYTCIEQNSA